MKAGYTISVVAHALILGWGVLTFSAKPLDAPEADPIAAEFISDTEFSKITNGSKTAKQTPNPTPVVDKVGEVKEPPKDPTLKVANKQEVVTDTAPPPAPPQPDPKPDPKPVEAKPPEPKPAAAPPATAAPPAPDPIAEALKREEAKKKEEQKKLEEAKKKEERKKLEEAKKREEQKRREAVNSDLDRIQAQLDRRAPQRQAVAGTIVNPTPSLGTTTGNAPQLSQSQLDWLRKQIHDQVIECWHPPIGAADARNMVVRVQFYLNRDGSLNGRPNITNSVPSATFEITAASAVRAVQSCAPLRLPPAKYEFWQDVEVIFDPKELYGG